MASGVQPCARRLPGWTPPSSFGTVLCTKPALWHRDPGWRPNGGCHPESQPVWRYGAAAGRLENVPWAKAAGWYPAAKGSVCGWGGPFCAPAARLAILDEPFRGLDPRRPPQAAARIRQHWENVTLLCVTHDVSETLGLPTRAGDRRRADSGGRAARLSWLTNPAPATNLCSRRRRMCAQDCGRAQIGAG